MIMVVKARFIRHWLACFWV